MVCDASGGERVLAHAGLLKRSASDTAVWEVGRCRDCLPSLRDAKLHRGLPPGADPLRDPCHPHCATLEGGTTPAWFLASWLKARTSLVRA